MSLAVVYTRAKLGINAPWSPSKSISPMACPAFIWSACRKPRLKKVKTACAAPLSTPTLISRTAYHRQSRARRTAQRGKSL